MSNIIDSHKNLDFASLDNLSNHDFNYIIVFILDYNFNLNLDHVHNLSLRSYKNSLMINYYSCQTDLFAVVDH